VRFVHVQKPHSILKTSTKYQPPSAEEVPDEHFTADSPVVPHAPDRVTQRYRPPTVEDCDEDEDQTIQKPATAPKLEIPQTLWPGIDYYQTCCCTPEGPETRARMIPNQPRTKPAPATLVAGRRYGGGKPLKPPLPPLSMPLPDPSPSEPQLENRPDLTDIRMTGAISFL